jgi:hypothetical protein
MHIYLRPGETIAQALIRAQLDATPPITLPPGVVIHGPEIRLTTVIDRSKTGIPFMPEKP